MSLIPYLGSFCPVVFKMKFKVLPDWTEPCFGFLVSLVLSLLIAVIVAVWIVPKLRNQITGEHAFEPIVKASTQKKFSQRKELYHSFIPHLLGKGKVYIKFIEPNRSLLLFLSLWW